jgi:3-deoxy-D-manno-octulosonic-acid transferase
MTRFLYAALWVSITPLVVLRLAWRSRRQRGYLQHLGERFGRYAPAAAAPRIWIHAVSVGETRAAAPLVEALARRYPDHRILITHMTPTGRATGEELFGDRVERAWLPYDLGFAVRHFLDRFKPRFGIVLETEIWPRLLEECARAGVPVVLANARLSARSAGRSPTSRESPRKRARMHSVSPSWVPRRRRSRETSSSTSRFRKRWWSAARISASSSASIVPYGSRAARARARKR